jgi:ribosome biogenesis GTPase / thiamine phosphate phosphatase
VGKSTLVNRLIGREAQKVGAVRAQDGRGRHTTTHRELLFLPGGGVLIDTPGMRELQLWTEGQGLREAFAEIEALSARCRFRDCRHRGEPGCAVDAALRAGALDPARLQSYFKLLDEQQGRRDGGAANRPAGRVPRSPRPRGPTPE